MAPHPPADTFSPQAGTRGRSPLFFHDSLHDDRKTGREIFREILPLVDGDAHRYALRDLGEVAGGVVRLDDAELGTGGRRESLDMAGELCVFQRIDADLDLLAGLDIGKLGFL